MGGITEIATSAPGYSSVRPNTKAPLAETLKLNGYSTAQFGKCHEVPVWQTSPAGPFDAGRPAAAASSTSTASSAARTTSRTRRCTKAPRPSSRRRRRQRATTSPRTWPTKAINWVRQQKALMPDKPFFMYFAPGATHAPHHVPTEWIDKYKGKFDPRLGQAARDHLRATEGTGRHPGRCRADATHDGDPGLGRHDPDAQAGPGARDGGLRRRSWSTPTTTSAGCSTPSEPVLDNTLVYLIIGDNGASAEGTLQGAFNEMANFNGMADHRNPRIPGIQDRRVRRRESYNHYAVGWAWAMDTPYQWTKQVASHWGGTRNGTIVHWPSGITDKGRSPQPVQPCHRRRAHRPGGGRHPRADDRSTASCRAPTRAPACCTASTTAMRPSGTRPSTSRCSATAASTTRAGAR